MEISQQYNKFYHGIVLKQAFEGSRQISFREWKDNRTGGCLVFYRDEDYDTLDELKQIFKLMNLHYPIYDDGKTSTGQISSGELSEHIEWVIKILGENGVLLPYIEEEWARVLEDAGIEK